jgi:hypothetical protein
MKKLILAFTCAAVAPLALAQTTTTQTTTQDGAVTQTETTTTSVDGTVTTFQPGQTIVVRQVGITAPVTYSLGKTVQYVNRKGRVIEASMIHPGVPVQVYYANAGDTRTVSKIVVDQDDD